MHTHMIKQPKTMYDSVMTVSARHMLPVSFSLTIKFTNKKAKEKKKWKERSYYMVCHVVFRYYENKSFYIKHFSAPAANNKHTMSPTATANL